MRSRATRAELSAAVRGALHPPLRESRFWAIQAMVVVIASVHLVLDAHGADAVQTVPGFISVTLLMIPVGYAALRYGLAGSGATAAWATLLWIPDLTLRPEWPHIAGDLGNLIVVDLVAFFFGQRIEAERLAHDRVERATAERLAAEAGYRRLFETNSAPILVLSGDGRVRGANPAAERLFGGGLLGRAADAVLTSGRALSVRAGEVVQLADGRDYRIEVAADLAVGGAPIQVIFEDVTAERLAGRRAERYAQLVVQAEEDQRLHLARELHDEPLQLFLHLARQLEVLAGVRGVPEPVIAGLSAARHQALDAAGRLRALARDLRPPALDQLGLVAAVSSLLADVEEESEVRAELVTEGAEVRSGGDAELGAFRVVQESVRNALRHGGADNVVFELRFGEAALALTVADDGCGFDPDSVDDLGSGHFGVLGMRERMRVLGGALSVESAPGRGTRVHAVVPLASERTPAVHGAPRVGAVAPAVAPALAAG